MKRIFSWNVNGIRAAAKKGLLEWMQSAEADIICLQETKAHPDQLDASLREPAHSGKPSGGRWHSYWASAEKKGYSGVVTFTREEPKSVHFFDLSRFDAEGRVLICEFSSFTLLNAYFPNSQAEGARLDYKLDFNNAILSWANKQVRDGKNILICGDFNVAHKAIDLERPKSNEKNPGYLPEERSWMDTFIEAGYVDTFRIFNPEPRQYTWWSYRSNAREKNVGWRIDYHCV
ncbi:MAG: exodeoxyribonuclease III, partial [Salinispira sp.]